MQVNISFNGTAPGNPISPNIQEVAGSAASVADGGGAPGTGGANSGSSDVSVLYQEAEEENYENIGGPPSWLHEAIAAHKVAAASETVSSDTAVDGIDGGNGPTEF